MELNLKFGRTLCCCTEFTINGICADEDDFGDKYDNNPGNEEPYGCGDMKFFPKLPSQEILDKYKITVNEYSEIAEKLEDGLSFGHCSLCI